MWEAASGFPYNFPATPVEKGRMWENLSTIVLATGALGTAAFGIVEGLKRWNFIGEAGFSVMRTLLDPIFVTLKSAYGDDVETLLRAQYRGEPAELTRVVRQGARLGLRPDNAERVARALGMINPQKLTAAAVAIEAGDELPADLRNVVGRFELAVDARVQAACTLASDHYETTAKIAASVVAIIIAIVVGIQQHQLFKAFLVGIAATLINCAYNAGR